MSTEITQVIAAVIGGLLAAGTGWFFENRKENARLRRARELITTGISDDLQHSVQLYEKISDEWDKSSTVWFSSLNELKESRSTYQNHRDEITMFDDAEMRKRLFKYYLRSGELIYTIEWLQNQRYKLERQFRELLRDIKLKNPTLTHDRAFELTQEYMEKENREYLNLPNLIEKDIEKLKVFRADAQGLLDDLGQSA